MEKVKPTNLLVKFRGYILIWALVILSTMCFFCKPLHPKVDRVLQHLKQLEEIAAKHKQSRSVANGHAASVEYVVNQLHQWNDTFKVIRQPVPINVQVDESSTVSFDGEALELRLDYSISQGSGSASFDNIPLISNYKTKPNTPWAAFIGPEQQCDNVILAIEMGASIVVTYSTPGNQKGYPFALQPSPGYCVRNASRIPTLAKAGLIGLSDKAAFHILEKLSQGSALLTAHIKSSYKTIWSENIIAETIQGDPSSVVVFGSHLDSVPNGPGINDDGSGSMATLELAQALRESRLTLKSQVRFAWWTAEEIGLLGSFYYMNDLLKNNPKAVESIKVNIDTDMIASSNYVRGVWSGETIKDPQLRQKCSKLYTLFARYFEKQKLKVVPFYFNGRSDFEPFLRAGIPAGGVITGEDEIKSFKEAEWFGGIPGMVLDPCYHQNCDRVDRISIPILKQNLDALAHVLQVLSTSDLDTFFE